MTRIGVISNPRSRQNTRGMAAIRSFLETIPGVAHRELLARSETGPALRRLAEEGVDLVVVNGGDGTVHSVVTEMLNGAWSSPLPRIAVLPAGTTNLIAADVGFDGSPVDALRRLLDACRDESRVMTEHERPVVSMRHAADGPPMHGMFFGTAAFYRGTMLGRAEVHPLGVEKSAAAALALFWFLLRAFFSRTGSNPLYRGESMEVRIDGKVMPEPEQFVLLGTTLRRLILGLRPFWGDGRGSLRYTSISFPPRRFGRAILPVMRGRPRAWMEADGYRSGLAQEMTLVTDCPIVMDGEIFPTSRQVPVVIRADHTVTFVQA